MLQVMERMPTRLSINVSTPDGFRARWGADERNPANQPADLSFSTAVSGGFGTMTTTLQRDPRLAWTDLEELADIVVAGVGGMSAFEGRIEQLPDTAGSQAQAAPSVAGWQNHLADDNSAAMIYIDRSLSAWQGMPLARQQGLLSGGYSVSGSSSVGNDPSNQDPALVLEIDGQWAQQTIAEAWYDAGAAGPIAKLYYAYTPGAQAQDGATNWIDQLLLSVDDATSTVETSGNKNGAGTSGLFSPATPQRFAVVQHYYTSAPAGADGFAYQAYWRLAVVGDHGLSIQGSWPGEIGVLASDVCAHAVGRWAPKLNFSTSGSAPSIQTSQFVIPQLAQTTPGNAAGIIAAAVGFEVLEWTVWENRTFYLNPEGASSKTRYWRARIGPAQLQETGADITRVYNGVTGSFTGTGGLTYTVGPPGSGAMITDASLLDSDPTNPANEAGIKRYSPPLALGTSTPAAAIQACAQYLQMMKERNAAGQASLVGHVQDRYGVWWPAWLVRAGDFISFTDASDTSYRRIISTDYTHSSLTNAVQLDAPPDTSQALLERLVAEYQSTGLN